MGYFQPLGYSRPFIKIKTPPPLRKFHKLTLDENFIKGTLSEN